MLNDLRDFDDKKLILSICFAQLLVKSYWIRRKTKKFTYLYVCQFTSTMILQTHPIQLHFPISIRLQDSTNKHAYARSQIHTRIRPSSRLSNPSIENAWTSPPIKSRYPKPNNSQDPRISHLQVQGATRFQGT